MLIVVSLNNTEGKGWEAGIHPNPDTHTLDKWAYHHNCKFSSVFSIKGVFPIVKYVAQSVSDWCNSDSEINSDFNAMKMNKSDKQMF